MLTKSALGVYYAHNTRRIACVERVAAVMWTRSSENAGDAGKKRARSSCPAKRSTRPWRSLQDRGSSGATSGENAGEAGKKRARSSCPAKRGTRPWGIAQLWSIRGAVVMPRVAGYVARRSNSILWRARSGEAHRSNAHYYVIL